MTCLMPDLHLISHLCYLTGIKLYHLVTWDMHVNFAYSRCMTAAWPLTNLQLQRHKIMKSHSSYDLRRHVDEMARCEVSCCPQLTIWWWRWRWWWWRWPAVRRRRRRWNVPESRRCRRELTWFSQTRRLSTRSHTPLHVDTHSLSVCLSVCCGGGENFEQTANDSKMSLN